ncbi:DUF624 domain-containing protein [Cellulomonas sp. ATA003]|uniref:DUF624 domain-containing protein n=1 Tax=Cellulomonas sp. ATA003 TaxID=3073064 RepID=UPI002873492C|nr:DUF624 domain-containing protein [Cellulomonas sp. ATA003]WNB86065.1 DUF624 domain-containing protein [Cellulomonas sp. ATA003]
MSGPAPDRNGPLTRAASAIYWFVVVEVLWVLLTAPGFVAALFLARDASNLPLYALAAVPVGPATAAALFAWRVFLRERDPSPAHQFGRGLRLGWADALRSWVPALVALVVLGTNVAYAGAAGLAAPVVLLQVVLGVVVLLWAVRMLALASSFSFRWRDAARLGIYTLLNRPLVTLGMVSLLVLVAGLAVVTFDAVPVLLASVLTYFLARNENPVLDDVQRRFVAPSPPTSSSTTP